MATCMVYECLHNWKFLNENAKTTAFTISPGYLCLGRERSRLEVYCITKSQYLTLLHSKDVSGVEVLEVNKLENLLAAVTQVDHADSSNHIFIYDIQSGECRFQSAVSEKITTVFWLGYSLYIGTASGKVLKTSRENNENFSSVKESLSLDSSIVQFDGSEAENILGISTYTRAFIYSLQDESIKEVGSKPRQGPQGVAVGLGRFWAARPGCRIWEVEISTAYVAATRQYRRVITQQGVQKIQTPYRSRGHSGHRNRRRSGARDRDRSSNSSELSSTSSQDGNIEIQEVPEADVLRSNGETETRMSEHGFSLLRKSNTTLVSFNSDGGIYMMDIHSSKLLAWTSISTNIRDVRLEDNVIVALDTHGTLHHLTFGTLDLLMKSAYKIQQFDFCGDIFVTNRRQIRSLDRDELKEIITMKDLSSKMRESSKNTKVYKLMDAVERLCISLDGRRPHDLRSISQERPDRSYLSRNSPVHDELIGGKSHSQEDLLDGAKMRRHALISGKLSLSSKELSSSDGRKLSAASRELSVAGRSSRELSASEQGLQALQLYKIKQTSRYSQRSDVEDSFYSLTGEVDIEHEDCMHKSMDALLMGLEERARSVGLELENSKSLGNELENSRTDLDDLADGGRDLQETKKEENVIEENTSCPEPGDELKTDTDINTEEDIMKKDTSEHDTILFSKRITQELRSAGLGSRMSQLAATAHKLINSLEMRTAYAKTFSNEFVSIYLDYVKKGTEDGEDKESLDLSAFLNTEEKRDVNLALIVILSDPKLLKLFVPPVSEVLDDDAESDEPEVDHPVHHHLDLVFSRATVRADVVIAKTLECFSGLLNVDTIVECLDVTHYYSMHFLLSLDKKLHPTLSPVFIEEVTEENVYNCSNFISTYKGFSTMHLVRYIVEIQKINFECGLHIIQSQVLSLPPASIFYICLQCLSFLNSITSENSRTGDLYGQIQAEWATFFSRALAVHIPGWPREWSHEMKQHPNLFQAVKVTFKSANQHFLSKQSTIKGSHKSLEMLELSPLCNLLMEVDSVDTPASQLAWLHTFSFMPGIVRCLLLHKELAVPKLPLLVEFGDSELLYDVGLISSEHCDQLVDHILMVYQKDECPLVWSEVGKYVIKSCQPDHAANLLTRLAVLMNPGDLPQSFYAELTLLQLSQRED